MNQKITAELLRVVQSYQAVAAIGPSTVRGQGAGGVVDAARRFLAAMPLERIGAPDCLSFRKSLDYQTQKLIDVFPKKAQSWGLARKCLNIFLHNAFDHRLLHREFLSKTDGDWYEIPLDRFIAEALVQRNGGELPRWKGVKHVKAHESELFQSKALQIARTLGIKRVHLDAYLWTERKLGRKK